MDIIRNFTLPRIFLRVSANPQINQEGGNIVNAGEDENFQVTANNIKELIVANNHSGNNYSGYINNSLLSLYEMLHIIETT
jgi:hypothetical protein